MDDVAVGVASSLGRVRSLNEDAWYAGRQLFVVADGMGGHAAGDVASSMTIDALVALDRADGTAADIRAALAAANEAILAHAQANPASIGMGTTVCGVLASEGRWLVFNVGDSRCYDVRRGTLRQVTTDHSEVQELVDGGRLTREEARVHPQRNVVTRAVGQTPPPQVDFFDLARGQGARLLLTSDGLTTEVPDAQIASCCAEHGGPQEAAEALVRAAEVAGGHDNITVLVIDDLLDVDLDAEEATSSPRSTVPRNLIVREAAQ